MHFQRLIEANPGKALLLLSVGVAAVTLFGIFLWRAVRSGRRHANRTQVDAPNGQARRPRPKRRKR